MKRGRSTSNGLIAALLISSCLGFGYTTLANRANVKTDPQNARAGQGRQKGDPKTPKADTAGSKHEQGSTQDNGAGDDSGQIVKAVIGTSRPEVSTSGGFGVYADLQNLSSAPITLFPTDVTLVVQPEVGSNSDCVWEFDGFFPTELPVRENKKIIIPPKEHYQVFWGLGSSGGYENCSDESMPAKGWASWFQQKGKNLQAYIGFFPGDYVFSVVGKAYPTPNGVQDSTYHTFVQGTKLHVGITQLESMIAAMIGGLIAYFVAGLREGGELKTLKSEEDAKKRSRWSKWGVIIRNMVSAALLSAVVTIILSRLSDTQFPIKVSVADFWGALTIGFVAYFTGNKLIDKIVGIGSGKNPSPTGGSAPAAGAN